jgi:hypothetical protein
VSAILKILSVVASIWGWFFNRKHSSSGQYEQAKSDNAKIIESHNQDAINLRVDELTNRVSNKQADGD